MYVGNATALPICIDRLRSNECKETDVARGEVRRTMAAKNVDAAIILHEYSAKERCSGREGSVNAVF